MKYTHGNNIYQEKRKTWNIKYIEVNLEKIYMVKYTIGYTLKYILVDMVKYMMEHTMEYTIKYINIDRKNTYINKQQIIWWIIQ